MQNPADRQQAIAALLAEGYFRLLRKRAVNCQSPAQIRPPDSPQLSGYVPPPE
jgi:hypothetical protein